MKNESRDRNIEEVWHSYLTKGKTPESYKLPLV